MSAVEEASRAESASLVAHPCQFSPEVLAVLGGLIRPGEHVHDPFAGTGLRLGRLCDELGATYSGGDIEAWPGRDRRVAQADALDPAGYPSGPFTVCTSPVYLNKRQADYPNGPLTTTKTSGRRDYGISLGRALAAGNLARHTGRPSRAGSYWSAHKRAVTHWAGRALVNLDSPIAVGWRELLAGEGFTVSAEIPVRTRRYRGLANADKRAEYEVVIVAVRIIEGRLV
jgi:hypothetical protein